jgi:chorismate lyase/3-hydroxybenzoate synthase
MSTVSTSFLTALTAPPRERSDLGVPAWVNDLLARSEARPADANATSDVRVVASPGFTLVSVRKPGAAALDPASFEACTRDAYTAIASQLRGSVALHPVRFWNYLPDIHRPCGGDGLDRYMCFNAGRFAACSDWLGGPDTFDRLLATGSGVGHAGDDLVIHALAAATPGTAVENPRQIPAYKYSRRFGPRPPCFARATVLRESGRPSLVLVGGTASIRGEESVHVGDLTAQTLETFENLAALVRSAAVGGMDDADDALDAFRDLRVYHVRDADRPAIADLVERTFPQLDNVEYLRADLCRRELSVEIEGIAELPLIPGP